MTVAINNWVYGRAKLNLINITHRSAAGIAMV